MTRPTTEQFDDEFGALVLRHLDGDLSPAECEKLSQRLADDRAARDVFVSLCIDAGRFAELYAADEMTVGEPDEDGLRVEPRIPATTRSRWQRVAARLTQPGSVSLVIAAVAISALLGILAWNNVPAFRPPDNRARVVSNEAPFVAQLIRSPDARWASAATGFADGTLLRAGERLELVSGTVDVLFNRGAQVTLAGPAVFVVSANNRGQLEVGRLTGQCPASAVGFSIRTPQVQVIDLGTEFGVLASDRGDTEVHVFQGAVRVEANDSELRRTLQSGQALRILNSGQMIAQASQPTAFVRRPLSASPIAQGDASSIRDDFDLSAPQLHGWASAWKLHGTGRVYRDDENPLGPEGKAYLRVDASNPEVRTLSRAFEKFGGVDPSKPHIVRWRWRFDGDPSKLTNFHDRFHFFGHNQSLAGTALDNAWLIAIAYGKEGEAQPPVGKWVFFHSRKSGEYSSAFAERNMINTGKALRPGAVYQFEVRVDPASGTYAATIDDGDGSFSAEGMHYRSGKTGANAVLHFGGCASAAGDDHAFALDSIEILPLAAPASN